MELPSVFLQRWRKVLLYCSVDCMYESLISNAIQPKTKPLFLFTHAARWIAVYHWERNKRLPKYSRGFSIRFVPHGCRLQNCLRARLVQQPVGRLPVPDSYVHLLNVLGCTAPRAPHDAHHYPPSVIDVDDCWIDRWCCEQCHGKRSILPTFRG